MTAEQAPAGIEEMGEGPDYVRLALLATILVALIGFLVYTRFINPPKKPFYAELPGISLAGIAEPQKTQIVKLANAAPCDCGYAGCDNWNVAECRNLDPGCDVSLKIAAAIVQKETGKPAVLTVKMPDARTPTPAPSGAPKKSGSMERHAGCDCAAK
ncbi:MAG: hypothetical protein FJX76_18940 [Armatimonadetes bacterium]|nr:hypothetical protein [Armatimonadota bacterium]